MRQIKPSWLHFILATAPLFVFATSAGADGTCYRCYGDYFYTPDAYCEIQSTPALDDGTCPPGYSLDVPDCRPNWDCRVGNAFCVNSPCCGNFETDGYVAAGCTCFGCQGFAMGFDQVATYYDARANSHVGCIWPQPPYTTLCGYYRNSAPLACYLARCGP